MVSFSDWQNRVDKRKYFNPLIELTQEKWRQLDQINGLNALLKQKISAHATKPPEGIRSKLCPACLTWSGSATKRCQCGNKFQE